MNTNVYMCSHMLYAVNWFLWQKHISLKIQDFHLLSALIQALLWIRIRRYYKMPVLSVLFFT